MSPKEIFHESNWSSVAIRDLGLTIEGTPLEPVLKELEGELERAGLRVRPRFYLSTDWGVITGTVAIAIPFYLAHPRLTEVHASKVGHVEGLGRDELLRYLRHEMGHVVCYAYRLYDREDWVRLFGSMTQPYLEEFRPSPFSRRYVRHLPGWYAQKHPDEDFAETFAVWMTPGLDWRKEYEGQPLALAKLEWCDQTLRQLSEVVPPELPATTEDDVGELACTVEEFYSGLGQVDGEIPPGIAGALRMIFRPSEGPEEGGRNGELRTASDLIRRLERDLMSEVYCWTGHFPERTRELLRQLAERCDRLGLVYGEAGEARAILGVTTLITALAMNHVHQGSYQP